MSQSRLRKISEEIKKIVSKVIMTQLKDPRVSSLSSVTHVEVTSDLRYATIYISLFDPKHSIDDQIEGLNASKGFIRREIGKNLKAHYTPEPIFKPDTSAEYGMKIGKILSELEISSDDEDKDSFDNNQDKSDIDDDI